MPLLNEVCHADREKFLRWLAQPRCIPNHTDRLRTANAHSQTGQNCSTILRQPSVHCPLARIVLDALRRRCCRQMDMFLHTVLRNPSLHVSIALPLQAIRPGACGLAPIQLCPIVEMVSNIITDVRQNRTQPPSQGRTCASSPQVNTIRNHALVKAVAAHGQPRRLKCRQWQQTQFSSMASSHSR